MNANVTFIDPSAGYLMAGEPATHTPPPHNPHMAQGLIDEIATAVFLGQSARLGILLHGVITAVDQACPPGPRQRVMDDSSPGRALGRLLEVERALRGVDEFNVARADAWRVLSGTYSALGMHAKAMSAAHRASRMGLVAGLPEEACACLSSRVRSAVVADQRGDTDSAVRDLRNVIAYACGLDDLTGARDRVYLHYAVRRLGALDYPVAVDVVADTDTDDPVINRLNVLIRVCDHIAGGRPGAAVRLLDALPASSDVFGEAESLRLRSLALHGAGEHQGALAAERAAHRTSRCHDLGLLDWLTAAVSANAERDWLRDAAQHYGLQARAAPGGLAVATP